jgi:hypothetical protein
MIRAAATLRFLTVAILVVGCPFFALAAQGGKVEQLAKEGHWEPEAWANHAKLLGKPAPDLANNEVARKYADKGVLVIGACGGEQEEKMNEVAEQTRMEYPTAKTTAASAQAWGVQWWPHYVVVDRKGMIRAAGIKPDYVEKIVEALVEEQGTEKAAK